MHNDKIVVPKKLQHRIIAWYHEYLAHPRIIRMEQTIKQVFNWDGMRAQREAYCKTFNKCQTHKKSTKSYGKQPPKENMDVIPWQRVNVDLIGPYKVKTRESEKGNCELSR